ncbi:hypothetical protein HZA57_05970, partial [Candidatus Poribacteria bacterium]|nr:hypothetical protein [Candidatus Poribacteria bacterium]
GRYILDTMEKDVSNIFYRDETSYNVQARQRLEEYQRALLDAEANDSWEDFELRYGPRDDETERPDGQTYIGNPFEQGRLIDLQFSGEDSEEQDTITFASRRPFTLGADYSEWGLARISYAVDNGVLIRSLEDVETPPRTWDGKVLEKETPPQHSIIAEGVVEFNLTYGFWYDNQWYEVDHWSSGDRQIRNPNYLLGEYSEEELATIQGGGVGQISNWNDRLNDSDREPLDRVPTYVRVQLALADPENEKRLTRWNRILRIPNSQETWVFNGHLDEDQQAMERTFRDQNYTPVYPGALRKQ